MFMVNKISESESGKHIILIKNNLSSIHIINISHIVTHS